MVSVSTLSIPNQVPGFSRLLQNSSLWTFQLGPCSGCLVIIDNKSSTVLLVHPTAREYLLTNLEVGNFSIVMACCTFPSYDVFVKTPALLMNPFLEYAASYLSYHLRPCDEALPVACFLRFLHNRDLISSYLQVKHVREDNRREFAFD